MNCWVCQGFSILLRIVELAEPSPSRYLRETLFQYPLADRRACGTSVAWRECSLQRFSILLRIVELAAARLTGDKSTTGTFQYPLADRRACGV